MGHPHEHHEHGASETKNTLSFEEKAAKLIAHWIEHNNDHGRNFSRWAEDFQAHGFGDAAELLLTAEQLTHQITHTLTRAAGLIPGSKQTGD